MQILGQFKITKLVKNFKKIPQNLLEKLIKFCWTFEKVIENQMF